MQLFVVPLIFSILSSVKPLIHDHESELTDVPKLNIIIFYQALDPYCKLFIRNQLYPSMAKGRFNVTNLLMLPYGKAMMDSFGHIYCRYGVDECQRNALHACILKHHKIEDALVLIACLMKDDTHSIEMCASDEHTFNVTNAKTCLKLLKIDDILYEYARESANWPYHYMPAVAVDNYFDVDEQEDFTENFDKAFCAKYKAKFNIMLENCK